MRRGVAYCRVSTDGQAADDKFGLDFQKEIIREYCEKNGIEIEDWFIDSGVSGAKESRPAMDRLLTGEVTNPPVELVIVAKADRIARDINLYYAMKSMLYKSGLEVVSVTEDWSAQDKLTAMILENFLAMAATVERENIRVRTSGGRRQKAKTGGYAGGSAPYGYAVMDKRLVVAPEEADAVRSAFEMSKRGSTLQEIADYMNAAGLKTHRGGIFRTSTIQTILANRKTYEGYYRYGKDSEWVKGQHEPILTTENA